MGERPSLIDYHCRHFAVSAGEPARRRPPRRISNGAELQRATCRHASFIVLRLDHNSSAPKYHRR
jgi:hypothetical protein